MQHTVLSVLCLKGTMSEAELHVLRARLQGGILNKARRGELVVRPPIGLSHNSEGRLVLDPDKQVQAAVQLLLATFRRYPSFMATLRTLRQENLLLPPHIHTWPRKGD